MITNIVSFRPFALGTVSLLMTVGTAQAVPSHAIADAQARYRADMHICNSGQSNQHITTCRQEARSALAAAKRDGLTAAPGQYGHNALQRCAVFQGDDRSACEARMVAPIQVDGSVEGGGLLRATETVTPAK